jgi:glycosyltransferase involved in cell wall biosynthesis
MDFTIITASYNYGHYIAKCLESVAMQECVEIEHLVMDAGSEDDTAAVVARFPHASFFQEPDHGMSDGINKGFRRAKGKWVMWLNADDTLVPGALAAVKACADANPDADVIYGCWDFMDADGRFMRRMTLFPFNRGMLSNLGCYIASTSTFFRRGTTIEQGFYLNIGFKTVMDGEYYCRLAHAGKKFVYLPKVLACFRLHDFSISQRNLKKTDIDGVHAHQVQLAEARAIRRVYGVRLFQDEMLNGVVEGVIFHAYRVLKGVLKWIYASKTAPV